MKKLFSTLLTVTLISPGAYAQTTRKAMEMEVKQAVLAFDKATAQRDIETLKTVLHPDYRVLANRFRGTAGVTLISRQAYLSLMQDGKIGGTSYVPEFRQISIAGPTAMVEVLLTVEGAARMHKYLLLTKNEENQWQVISDLPLVVE